MELNIIHGKFLKVDMADINKVFLKKQRDTNVSDYIGSQGEIFFNTTSRELKVSDGTTQGGQGIELGVVSQLGVGTTNPSDALAYQLEVWKYDTEGPTIGLHNSENKSWINNWGSTGPADRKNRFEINATQTTQAAYAAQKHVFMAGGAGDTFEKFRIESTGDVSIGGMDANSFNNYNTLTIGGAGAVDGAGIDLERSDGNIYGRFFADANGVQIGAVQTNDYIRFETNNGTERLRISPTLTDILVNTRVRGVTEKVGTALTYESGDVGKTILECDVSEATTYTYSLPDAGNIGIVSFKNLPVSGIANGTTVTIIFTQNSSTPTGFGNTTMPTGIGTFCRIHPYDESNFQGLNTLIDKTGKVGSGTTVTLSTVASDVDFVSFYLNYNGGTNTSAANYDVYVTKNGNFR